MYLYCEFSCFLIFRGIGSSNGLPLGVPDSIFFAAINSPKKLNIIGAKALVPTGVRVEVPMGYEIQVRPKSGLANKFGVTVLNTPGTVDSDYRGEVGVILILLTQGKFVIEPGMKIAQMVMAPVAIPSLEIVDDLSDTSRGEGGFGSTGS